MSLEIEIRNLVEISRVALACSICRNPYDVYIIEPSGNLLNTLEVRPVFLDTLKKTIKSSTLTPSINGMGAITVPAPCFDGTPGVNFVIVGRSKSCFDIVVFFIVYIFKLECCSNGKVLQCH